MHCIALYHITYLEEDSEVYNSYCCTDKHWLKLYMVLIDQQYKSKCYCSSQPTI